MINTSSQIRTIAAIIAVWAGSVLSCLAGSIAVQCESGSLGAEWAVSNSVNPAYITITTTGGGDNPGSANRVAAYNVTFPAPGTYELYAHVRVGSDPYNDDSFFYAGSFGVKSPTAGGDWVTVNGLGNPSGFNNSSDVVTSGGSAGNGVWKWLNLSRYQDGSSEPGVTFTVPAGNLTQTFQIGGRENGLDIDKFVFGTAGYTFTVANLDSGTDGMPPAPPTATIDTTKVFQTVEGLGGAICFYNGWFTAHPYKEEIYSNAFAGLNLSMLRLGNWFRYQGTPNFDTDAREFVAKANSYLGHPVPVYMSSWAPPAFLKSNGQVGNGGSLIYTNGGFAYDAFATYWYDSLQAYRSNGVSPTWISIQNEPDFVASYDSCVLKPSEEETNYASYSIALDRVHQRLANDLPSPPKLLAPEVVHVSYNTLVNYAATMNPNSFYGVAHHLYGDGGGTGDSFLNAISSATNVFPSKPRFMTEYGDVFDMIECANLIYNSLVVEQVSGYNHWNLLWPGATGGLIQIENPWNQSSWTNAPVGTPTQSHGWWYSPSYWSMKHFSYFIQPGYKRVSATDTASNIRSSAFLSPDGLRLVVVLINTDGAATSTMDFNFGDFSYGNSGVYQTANTNYYFKALGSLTNAQVLPPRSLTTVVLDKFVTVGRAAEPSPADGISGVALNPTLAWMPGSNALTHAVYLGINSNALVQAGPGSPELKGVVAAPTFSPSLISGATYYWRVDEIAGINTNKGSVWSFSTVAPIAGFTLSATDNSGSSSFITTGSWTNNATGAAATSGPTNGFSYRTGPFTLRTPAAAGNYTFGGDALTVSSGGTLYIKGGGGNVITFINLTNAGTITDAINPNQIATIAGYMSVVGGSFNVSGGPGDNRAITNATTMSGSGALTNYGTGYVVYTGNNLAFTGPIFVTNTTLQVGSQANLGGNPPGFNAAQLQLNNGTFQPLASFALNNPNSGVTVGANGGVLNAASGLTLTVSNPLAGPGNLSCLGGGTVALAGNNTATGNLIVSNSTLALLGGATFKNAQLGVSNNATLDLTALNVPLSISNRITLAGNLVGTINKAGFTSLLTASNIAYGGTLALSNSGPALAYGDIVKLFGATNYSGAFSGISPATPGTGLIWNTNWLSVDGTIFVSASDSALMTPPVVTGIQLQGENLVMTGTNGNAPGTPFYTLAATNLALPLADWMVIATNQFGAAGGFVCTNAYDSASPQQFFRLRIP